MSGAKRLIVNIRGANAAGKTTLAANFHNPQEIREIFWGEGGEVKSTYSVWRHPALELPVYLLGPYGKTKYAGGDTIKSADAIEGMVRQLAEAQSGHVVFEGFRVSKSYARFAALRNALVRETGATWLWAFLHAPKDLIWERAQARREDGKLVDKKELEAVVRQMNKTRDTVRYIWPKDVLTLDPTQEREVLVRRLIDEMAARERGETLGAA